MIQAQVAGDRRICSVSVSTDNQTIECNWVGDCYRSVTFWHLKFYNVYYIVYIVVDMI